MVWGPGEIALGANRGPADAPETTISLGGPADIVPREVLTLPYDDPVAVERLLRAQGHFVDLSTRAPATLPATLRATR